VLATSWHSLLLVADPPCWFWKLRTTHPGKQAGLADVRNPHVHHTAVAEALHKPVQTLFLSIPDDLKHLSAAAGPVVETLQAPQESLGVMRRTHIDDRVPAAARTSRIHGNEDKVKVCARRKAVRLQPAHHIISGNAAGQVEQPEVVRDSVAA